MVGDYFGVKLLRCDYFMALDSPLFLCGKLGGIVVRDEHDEAGTRYCDKRNVQHYRETGEYAPLEQQVDWIIEGTEASRRRASMTL